MAISRLRLRIAAGFAGAFAVALALLAAGALGYLWRESNRRFDVGLQSVISEVERGLIREAREAPTAPIATAASEVAVEWPHNGDAFVILDDKNAIIATVGPESLGQQVVNAWLAHPRSTFSIDKGGLDQRAMARTARIVADDAHISRVTIISFGSTEGIESDTQLLGVGLAIAAPLIVILSLAAGYLLARRALNPVTALGNAIAAVAPDDLSMRLPLIEPRDEIGTLAGEFNALLARLSEAQLRNRGFVREAAHQIRTPLTLVLGEASHELANTDSSPEKMRATLSRIRSAAEQMRRRVDELFLLAEAQSGEIVRLESDVELDGLVLEATDLMRARATALGRALAIRRADHVVVRGNEALLKEAVVELLENACKYGNSDAPITVSSFVSASTAVIEVASTGASFTVRERTNALERPEGLGLPIVKWVAESHNGTLSIVRDGETNRAQIILPIL